MKDKVYGRKIIRRKNQFTKIYIILIIYALVMFSAGLLTGAMLDDLLSTPKEPIQQTIINTVE